ncbi:MAG: hypothetical protein Kow0062_16890 [Acidobacteriota bacterium]|nr:MAG: helix-hairpin-helix domain-containing protein [Acidobacteriota bacterium]
MKRIVQLLLVATAAIGFAPVVPATHAAPASSGKPSGAVAKQARVDVNRAGIEELVSVKGIGPALARRIVEHRKQHGPFESIDDLLAVQGIGPKLLARIRDRLTVGAADRARR